SLSLLHDRAAGVWVARLTPGADSGPATPIRPQQPVPVKGAAEEGKKMGPAEPVNPILKAEQPGDGPRPTASTDTSGRDGTDGRAAAGTSLSSAPAQRFAAAVGENTAWLEAHEAEILRLHPEWADKYVVVASRTPLKILAVAANRNHALD